MDTARMEPESVDILLVEDNPVDILVTRQALEESGFDHHLHVAEDGEAALDFLNQNCNSAVNNKPCPDLILLDINLPKKNGKEVLAEIKKHPKTLHIPVVMLTTSDEEKDINESYSLHANCYITKPVGLDNFMNAIRCVGGFWMELAKLPLKN
ncbi:MAG TPA: response regulator [Desulfomonilaceae bacterium]|nr:response regulator [Desulfomonilaceae bacterium]